MVTAAGSTGHYMLLQLGEKTMYDSRKINHDEQKTDSERLGQFEKNGFRIQQLDEDFFMIERLKSGKVTWCRSISDAEVITYTAIQLERNRASDTVGIRRTLLDKSYILLGLIDIISCEGQRQTVRRRTKKCQRE